VDSWACGPKLCQSSPSYNAVVEEGAVDDQEWDIYCLRRVPFPKGYEEFHLAPLLGGRAFETVEFGSNIGSEVALRQLESLEQPGVHDVARGPCVY